MAQGLGAACDAGSQCPAVGGGDGVCVEGVCCDSACEGAGSCRVLGSEGTCTAFTLGSSCDAGSQCNSNFSADGVCCQTECDGGTGEDDAGVSHGPGCVYCSDPLSPGVCIFAPDGTDPHGTCSGDCNACFAGSCGSATVGTNPHQACDASAGLACGADGSCDVIGGGACDSDTDCASGRCTAGVCLSHSLVEISMAPMNPDAQVRYVSQAAISTTGEEAVAFSEFEPFTDDSDNMQTLEDEQFAAVETGGAWQVVDLYPIYASIAAAQANPPPIAIAFLGNTLELVGWNDPSVTRVDGTTCQSAASTACGLFSMEICPDGSTNGPHEVDASATGIAAVSLLADGEGNLSLSVAGSSGAGTYQRRSGGAWTGGARISIPNDDQLCYAFLDLAGGRVLLYTESLPGDPDLPGGSGVLQGTAGLGVLTLEGGALTSYWIADGGTPCPSGYVTSVSGATSPDLRPGFITLGCEEVNPDTQMISPNVLLGWLDPSSPVPLTWLDTGLTMESTAAVIASPQMTPLAYVNAATAGGPSLVTVGVAGTTGGPFTVQGAQAIAEEDAMAGMVATTTLDHLPLVAFTTVLSLGASNEGIVGPPHLYILTYSK